ncbi:MAG: hypothetical protein IH969_06410, partial [Candidatus Krumholzibacteriota bacterium]|nr:hypothetical protein [Candidatus Krumholzibacteriota bacterium]
FALGMFSLSIGVFYITLPPLFSLIVESDAVRYYAQILSYMIFPVWLYVFVETVLGGHRVVRALWIVQAVYAVVWLAVDLTGVGPRVLIESVSPFIFSITILIMIGVAGRVAFSGHREARILLFGIMIMGLAGLNDLLMGIVFPYWHWISPAGTFIFILVLVYITDNRYAQRNRLLKTYSLQLEEKSEQLEEHARTLEQKVTERTRDLDTRNQELAGTLDELRDTQEQLVLREKMASLGNLVAGVAHEVNNPVGAIVSAADASSRCIKIVGTFVEEHGGGEPRLHKALAILGENNEIITTASQRVTNIVRSLRNFSRLDEAEFQKADLHEGLDSTLTLVHHQMKDRVEVVKEYGDLPLIECYPNQLNQVFMNLLTNAADAIEGEGTITITTEVDGDRVKLAFSDTGVGMPNEVMSKIFDPFYTTKEIGKGTGLGLSISYGIVEKHGGKIEVESVEGEGTTFRITLPIRMEEEAKKAAEGQG